MRFIPTILLAGAVSSQLGATDCGNVLRDSSFDLWCGDQLCAWKVERGEIARVATWNEGDPGVELLGDDAAIEQLAPVDSGDGQCIEFTLIANVDPNAEVDLNVDVLGDGTIDHSERLPASNWKPLSYDIFISAPYAGVRFEISKKGAGHARLAKIGAKIISEGCQGLTPIVVTNRPLGTPCNDPSQCASGICGPSAITPPFMLYFNNDVCLGCDADHACTGGDVCGSDDPVGPVRAAPIECVAPASRMLGEQCAAQTECAEGFCTYGTCSTCNVGTCANGETCGPSWDLPYGVHSPWTCSPLGHARASGEPCAANADCASNACTGTPRMQCDDGRTCATSADCPFGKGTDSAGNLQNGACNAIDGVQGGSCQ
jgi:hypothetical protein